MKAVKEQREKFWKLSSEFAQRLKLHLINIFQRHVSSQVSLCLVFIVGHIPILSTRPQSRTKMLRHFCKSDVFEPIRESLIFFRQ